ncbi:MAG: GNAT family N-acetyltransferase [Flavobacteriaceae bacterium]|nr:GNAT family N-acetyltransferase [Flavobacteriaceae bacterium]
MIIRKAENKDFNSVLRLIKELAEFEKEPDAVVVTEDELIRDYVASCFDCLIAELDGEILGMAVFYHRYSTWKGKTIHLEDLIVTQKSRNKGVGKALLDEIIKTAKAEKVRRLEWCVLDWNTNAIEFYKKKGGTILKDWYLVQMDEQALNK